MAFGQNVLQQKIKIEAGTYTIISIYKILSDQNVELAYSSDQMPATSVTLNSGLMSVRQLLRSIKKQTGVQFKFLNGVILPSYQKQVFTLSGLVKDAQTGEVLIGASILINDTLNHTAIGTVTNSYGFYSLTLPMDSYSLSFRFVGYQSLKQVITLDKHINYTVNLSSKLSELQELLISSTLPDYNVQNTIPGISPINFGVQWPIPYFLGEEDIFQNSLLLPGIQSVGEDASGLNIRGGDIDQNLILLDGAPIYNPHHFYGLISIFSPEVVNNVSIMKGYIPVQYGGRAASVIDVIQKEGNSKKFCLSGGIGLVSGRLTVEGPLKKDQSSFLFSVRQSLINFSIEDFVNQSLNDSRTTFRDFNAKINWHINNKNRIYLSGYFGQDRNRAGFGAIRTWGNRSMTMRWNHIFNPELFSNFTGVISTYAYQIADPQEAGSFIGKSDIVNYILKADFDWITNPSHSINFGVHSTLHELRPGERIPFDKNASTNETFLDKEHAIESNLYLSHTAKFLNQLSIQYGMRFSSLLSYGPGNVYTYEGDQPKSDATITDTLNYFGKAIFHKQSGWEPRLSINYRFNETHSIKASYSTTYQFIHLISNTIAPSPTDIWKLSDTHINPTISDHYSLGYYKNSRNNKWESNIELYYNKFKNTIDVKDGADLLFNENIETELLNGEGRSIGMEIFIKRKTGKIRGWMSYTLSKSEQKFEDNFFELTINDGDYFRTKFDRKHDLTIVGIVALTDRLSISSSFNYTTGRPITLPAGKFILDGKIVPHFEGRNQSRLPSYNRLDLSLKWNGKKRNKAGGLRKITDYWSLSLYNVYARKNIYSYSFRKSKSKPGMTETVPYSIFGTIIPAVTYNFKF